MTNHVENFNIVYLCNLQEMTSKPWSRPAGGTHTVETSFLLKAVDTIGNYSIYFILLYLLLKITIRIKPYLVTSNGERLIV